MPLVSKKHPPARSREQSKAIQSKRQARASELYLEGWTEQEIADELGCSQQLISMAIRKAREEWKARAELGFEEAKAEQLTSLRHLKAVALRGYALSLKNAEVDLRVVEQALRAVKSSVNEVSQGRGKRSVKMPTIEELKMVPVKDKHEKRVSGQSGNPAYLQVARACDELICKILGIVSDVNLTQNNIFVGSEMWEKLTEEMRAARLDTVEDRIARALTVSPQLEQTEAENVAADGLCAGGPGSAGASPGQ